MAKPTTQQKIASYKIVLAKYEREGDPMASTQRRLIARMEKDAEREARG